MKKLIYIAAYPKSGSTWLARLLGDILDSPSGGCVPAEDALDVATEGLDRPGPYVVRRGHFTLIDDEGGAVVPAPHKLAWKMLTDERLIFLVRDPRDICVSGAWHWQTPVEQFLERMIAGDVAGCGRWDTYCDRWYHLGNRRLAVLSYEKLLDNAAGWLHRALKRLKLPYEAGRLAGAIERQSFAARREQVGDDEQALRRNHLRKGVAGDWKNHFTPEMNERLWREFGWMMERLGYEY